MEHEFLTLVVDVFRYNSVFPNKLINASHASLYFYDNMPKL